MSPAGFFTCGLKVCLLQWKIAWMRAGRLRLIFFPKRPSLGRSSNFSMHWHDDPNLGANYFGRDGSGNEKRAKPVATANALTGPAISRSAPPINGVFSVKDSRLLAPTRDYALALGKTSHA